MGKFFNGKVRKDRGTLIKYGVIAAGVLLIIILFVLIAAGKNKKSDVVLELKESFDIEVNSEWPEKMDFFTKFENFDENLVTIGDFDITTVGEYIVTVTAEGQGSAEIKVNVVDTTPPVLTLQDLEIESGGIYEISDFLLTCEDNSGGDCIVEYYSESLDQYGNPIDYASFTEDGKYSIKILAKDETGNASDIQSVNLTIGAGQSTEPTPAVCNYGDLTVNTNKHYYPIAVIVGDEINGCALDRDLWDNDTVQSPVNALYDADYTRLKTQLQSALEKNFPNGAKIVAYPRYISILNAEVKGLVGYAIHVKVYVADASSTGPVDSDENLKLSYYIRSDKTREYEINKFDIAQ
ncbi:MAG: hypothetical protein E7167_05490 [Firmicutes bacterium]|nr:hypothetical protein [Bacillota bacterium]